MSFSLVQPDRVVRMIYILIAILALCSPITQSVSAHPQASALAGSLSFEMQDIALAKTYEEMQLSVTIHNNAEIAAEYVGVIFYANYREIGRYYIREISVAGEAQAHVSWSPKEISGQLITIAVVGIGGEPVAKINKDIIPNIINIDYVGVVAPFPIPNIPDALAKVQKVLYSVEMQYPDLVENIYLPKLGEIE